MKLTELLDKRAMCLDLKTNTKCEVIDEMISLLCSAGAIKDRILFKKEIIKRENLGCTGIGFGIAIPHAKTSAVKKPTVAFGISKSGVDYDSIDGKKVNLIFMIAVGDNDSDLHLKALANLSRSLMHKEFREKLLNAKTEDEILDIFNS